MMLLEKHYQNAKKKASVWIEEVSILKTIEDYTNRDRYKFLDMVKFLFKLIFHFPTKAFCYFSFKEPLPYYLLV